MFNKLILILMLSVCSISHAEDNRPIRMVVPFGAGGLVDTISRQFESELSKELDRTIWMDYKPGAAGLIGIKNLAQTRTDEVVITFIDTIALANIMLLNDGIGIDDVRYIVQVGVTNSIALAVTKNSPLKNIDAWRKRKTPINVGINGFGGAHHYYSYIFANQTQAPITDIPFKGVGEMITNLTGGHVDAIWANTASLEQFEQIGKIDIVAVNHSKRTESLPNVPTFKELGIDVPPSAKWIIICNETANPTTVRQVEQAVNKLINSPAFAQNLKILGLTVEPKAVNQSRSSMTASLQQQAKFAEYIKMLKK